MVLLHSIIDKMGFVIIYQDIGNTIITQPCIKHLKHSMLTKAHSTATCIGHTMFILTQSFLCSDVVKR